MVNKTKLNEEQKQRVEFAQKIGETKDQFKERMHKRAIQLVELRTKLQVKVLGHKDKYARTRHSEKLEYLREKNDY